MQRKEPIPKPFRDDCAAIRATSKTFYNLEAPAAALFYDFNVFVTRQSLEKLELVSQHPMLRRQVHRLVFCRPSFQPWLAKASAYKAEVGMTGSYSPEQKEAGRRAYRAGLREQTRLLRYGTYRNTSARCMSRLPRLCSISMSESAPFSLNFDLAQSRSRRPTTFQRQHPQTLLKWGVDVEHLGSADRHIRLILQAVAIAGVRIEDFVTHDMWGPGQYFRMDDLSGWSNASNLSTLTRLDIHLRHGQLWHASPNRPDLSKAICPLLEQMPALTDLYLRYNCDWTRPREHATISHFWDVHIPKLSTVVLEGLSFTPGAIRDFLCRHDQLEKITLWDVSASESWSSVFKAMREHPTLKDFEISDVDGGRLHYFSVRISTTDPPELPQSCGDPSCHGSPCPWKLESDTTDDLSKYLHGKGEWTERLAEKWKWP